jgi:hypothetical protein
MISGLIIRSPYIDKILKGEKVWEIRGTSTKKRGSIALIKAGSKCVVGFCKIVDVIGPLTKEQFCKSFVYHQDDIEEVCNSGLPYLNTFAWVLKDVQPLEKPIPYNHPAGAITWVKLPEISPPYLENK